MDALAFLLAGLVIAGWIVTLVAVGSDSSIPRRRRPIRVTGLIVVPALAPGYWLWRWFALSAQKAAD
jgi:hypothetical protein